MKGLAISLLILFASNLWATQDLKNSYGHIILNSGEKISFKSLQDRTNVLKSLREGENIELFGNIYYPEEISMVKNGKLTIKMKPERKPHQDDYCKRPNQEDYT
jgi:hypothetical protein